MNYQKIYDNLINRARNRPSLNEYIERHHIVPKSIGGSNDSNNIVELMPDEHYLAHLLLVKIYPKSHNLIHAANMMSAASKNNKGRNNKSYAWVRKRHAKNISETLKEKKYYHNPSTGERMIVLKNHREPDKNSGFIRGRGLSPKRGPNRMTEKRKRYIESSRSRFIEQFDTAREVRWDKYKINRLSKFGSEKEVADEINLIRKANPNKYILECENKFEISRSMIFQILKRNGYSVETKFGNIIDAACSQIGINRSIADLRSYLLHEFDWSLRRPPFKQIRDLYPALTVHVIKKVINDESVWKK